MSRLPQPGADIGTWGDILNEFLRREHNVDGTHNTRSILNIPTAGNMVPVSDMTSGNGIAWQSAQTFKGADGRNVQLQTNTTHVQWRYVGDSIWTDLVALTEITGPPGPVGQQGQPGPAAPDATTTTKGKMQLAGDLAGTADTPTTKSRPFTITIGPAGTTADIVCDFINDEADINAAITTLHTAGGGVLMLRAGNYKIQSSIIMQAGVTLRGEGNLTVLSGYGSGFPVITGNGNTQAPMTDTTVRDLKIDCTHIVDASYTTSSKGIYMYCLQRATFKNLYIYNAPASGLGTDFLVDSVIHGCTVESAGRQFAALGGTVGSNGIGIGTGVYAYESVTVSDCHAVNCGNNGIMFEEQYNNVVSKAMMAVNCTAIGCKVGFRASSNRRLIFANCHAANNTAQGFYIARSYIASPTEPKQISIVGSHIYDNGADGLLIDSEDPNQTIEQLNILGCQIGSNNGLGIKVINSTNKLLINGCHITANAKDGIKMFAMGTTHNNATISGNQLFNNGTLTAGTYHGINITQQTSGSFNNLAIIGNRCFDDQATQTQEYGIFVSGTHNSSRIFMNDVSGSRNVGGMSLAASASLRVFANLGYATNNLGAEVIGGVGDPLALQDAATKSYVDTRAALNVAVKTNAYTLTVSDGTVLADATTAAFTITLPTAIGSTGRRFTIKKVDASANVITVATTASQAIDGASSKTLGAQWKFIQVQADGANWQIVGSN